MATLEKNYVHAQVSHLSHAHIPCFSLLKHKSLWWKTILVHLSSIYGKGCWYFFLYVSQINRDAPTIQLPPVWKLKNWIFFPDHWMHPKQLLPGNTDTQDTLVWVTLNKEDSFLLSDLSFLMSNMSELQHAGCLLEILIQKKYIYTAFGCVNHY